MAGASAMATDGICPAVTNCRKVCAAWYRPSLSLPASTMVTPLPLARLPSA